ncbi:MAG: aminoacyl-tRNA deacylase [Janthinobacterium lividum]
MKTNAARLLDTLGLRYEPREYAVNPDDLSAGNVATKIGLPLEQVFKTLLCRLHEGEYVFAVLPGDAELDLKKLAQVADSKKAELASLKDVEPLTGYVRGGVTVMGAKKSYRAFADESIELFDIISVSAGMRGLQLLLAPADYLRASGAVVADLTRLPVAAV